VNRLGLVGFDRRDCEKAIAFDTARVERLNSDLQRALSAEVTRGEDVGSFFFLVSDPEKRARRGAILGVSELAVAWAYRDRLGDEGYAAGGFRPELEAEMVLIQAGRAIMSEWDRCRAQTPGQDFFAAVERLEEGYFFADEAERRDMLKKAKARLARKKRELRVWG